MIRGVGIFLGMAGLLVVSGCSSMQRCSSSSVQSLETRVSTLENKVDALEGGTTERATPSGEEVVMEKPASGVTAETMTKKEVQEALKNAGYYDGNIDGKFGPRTTKAIKEFQENMGLKVDGIAGPMTKEKLLKYLS